MSQGFQPRQPRSRTLRTSPTAGAAPASTGTVFQERQAPTPVQTVVLTPGMFQLTQDP